MMLKRWWTAANVALMTTFLSALALAQQADPSVDVTTTTESTQTWYTNWYIWAAVGVFLIVVIALTNRGSRQT